jgi:phosphoglycerate dehydrogenase-like enzyme
VAEAGRFRVAVLDDYQRAGRTSADWVSLGPDVEVVFFHDHVGEADGLVERLQPFDAVCAMRERTALPASVIERLPRLQLIVTAGPFNAVIDVGAAAARGVTVCGTTGIAGVHSTIELAWGLIFAVARDIPREDAGVRAGAWQVATGTMLHGKTLGVVGLGNFGPLMVPVARALSMDVVAWSRNLTDARAAEVGVTRLDREEFFARSDVVTVHVTLGHGSVGYVGRDELRAMRPTAFLVNTSRGPIVDEAALVEALREGWIAGAGLDVYDEEPLPVDHPLRHAPNTVLSPHKGYVSVDTYRQFHEQFVEDIAAFRAGSPVRIITPPSA